MEHIQLSSLPATQALALFETSKEQRSQFVEAIATAVADGEISPLKAHLQLKAMEDIINSLTVTDEKKNSNVAQALKYRKAILDEASSYGKTFALHNAKFDIKEVGTRYDYSVCNDPILNNLQAAADKANEDLKARQKFLQFLPESGLTEVNEDTGEAITIYRPIKTSTTALTVSLK